MQYCELTMDCSVDGLRMLREWIGVFRLRTDGGTYVVLVNSYCKFGS